MPVRLITLLVPVVASALISLGTLFNRIESKDVRIQPSMFAPAHLLVLSLLSIVYLACEHTIGWHPD